MAFPPFVPDPTDPADNSIQALFPANERAYRAQLEAWMVTEHDEYGHHVIPAGSTTARNAISTWGPGNLWINTDFTPPQLQRQTAAFPGSTWEVVGSVSTPTTTTNGYVVTWANTSGSALGTGYPISAAGNGSQQIPLTRTADGYLDPSFLPPSGAVAGTYNGTASSFTLDATGRVTATASIRFIGSLVNIPAAGGSATWSHGLGATPNQVQAFVQCTSANSGYSAGDRVFLTNADTFINPGHYGYSTWANSTTVGLQIDSAGGEILIFSRQTGGALIINSAASSSWQLGVVASL